MSHALTLNPESPEIEDKLAGARASGVVEQLADVLVVLAPFVSELVVCGVPLAVPGRVPRGLWFLRNLSVVALAVAGSKLVRRGWRT